MMFLIDKFKGYLLSFGVFVTVLASVYFNGLTKGARKEKEKQEKLEEEAKVLREKVNTDVEKLSNSELNERLSKWVLPDKR